MPGLSPPASSIPLFRRIAIIGTGLLGTSLGLALKKRGCRATLVGIGRRQITVERAREMGGIDIATTDLSAGVAGCDLIVIAAPLGHFSAIFAQLGRCEDVNGIITDVGSAKQAVLAAAHEHLSRPELFVPAHPMAGSEKDGPEAALADLFVDKPCVVTPDDTTDGAALKQIEDLWSFLGMRVLRMSAAKHDRQVAVVSHLPHLAAGVLVELAAAGGGWELASTGFADATRLAGGHAGMWSDIVAANRKEIVEALRTFSRQAGALADRIDQGDDDAIRQWLQVQKDRRERWGGD